MKTLIKIAAVVLALLVVGAAGLTIFIKVKFPPEKLKVLVSEQAQKHLRREVKLTNISVGLFRGLSLEGFELSEPPNFQAGRFLASKSLSVKPFLLPLLKGTIVVKSVDLEEPTISIVRLTTSTFNFSDLASPSPEAETPTKSEAPKVFVNRLTIAGGVIKFEDRTPEQMNIGVKDLDLSINGFSFIAPFQAELACSIEGTVKGKKLSGRVEFAGSASLLGEKEATIKKLQIELLKTSVKADGTVKNFSDPVADLHLKIESFDPQSIAGFVSLPPILADVSLSGDMKVRGNMKSLSIESDLKVGVAGAKADLSLKAGIQDPMGELAYDATVTFSDLSVEKSPLMSDLKVSGPLNGEILAKGTMKTADAQVSINGDRAEVRYGTLAVKESGGTLRVTAKSRLKEPFDNPAFEGSGEIGRLVLGSGPPLPDELKLAGPVGVKFMAKGALSGLASVIEVQATDLALSYAAYFAKAEGIPLTVSADVGLKNQKDLKINSCKVTLDTLRMSVQGGVSDLVGAGRLDLGLTAQPFAVGSLSSMVPMLKEYKVDGKSGFDVSVRGSFDAPKIAGVVSLKGLDAVPMAGVTFSSLNGTLNFTEDSAATEDLKGKFNGSDLTVRMKAQNFERMDLWCEGELQKLDAGALMQTVMGSTPSVPSAGPAPAAPVGPAPIAKTRGSFRVGSIVHPNYDGRDFRLTWDMTEVGPDMGKSNGTSDLTAANGKIHDLPLATKINKLVKKDASEIPYDKMSGHFRVTQGVLDTQDFVVNGPLAEIFAKGTVNLVNLEADMRIFMKLAKGSVSGSIEEWFSDEEGRPTLEATVKGPLSDPTIRPDLSKAAKKAAEDALRKGMEQLKEKFGGGGASSTTAPGEEPSKKQEQIDKALEQGQKALDKFFKKRR